MSHLTGRTRYRVGWFGRLVLQVEYAVREPHPGTEGRGTDWKWTGRAWRDARCEDFLGPDLAALFRDAPIPHPEQRPTVPSGTMPGGIGTGPGAFCLACGDKHALGVQCPSLRPQAGGRP